MNIHLFRLLILVIVGLLISVEASAETYTYDAAGRLTKVDYADGSSLSYDYDANGNRLNRTVVLKNIVPIASNDTVIVQSDTSVNINILSNDNDNDGQLDATTVAIVTDVTHGSTSIDAISGQVTYTPSNGYVGDDFFTYTVRDDRAGLSNLATVSITVQVAPTNQVPLANDDAVSTAHNTAVVIAVLDNDSDSDGTIDATTVIIVNGVASGTTSIDGVSGAVTYTPNDGASGIDSFTYTVNDNEGTPSNIATVTITVDEAPPNQAPVALDESVSTDYETAVVINVLSNDSDTDGSINASSLIIVTDVQNGQTTVSSNGQVTYSPANDFSGTNTFTYTVSDDDGAVSNVATVTITVKAKPSSGSSSSGGGSTGSILLLLVLIGLMKRWQRNKF